MRRLEWSRSRYWLCHFLHSRHVRLRIDWADGQRLDEASRAVTLGWLRRQQEHLGADRSWLLAATASAWPGTPDHALLQCLRLMIKEQQHLAGLHARAVGRYPTPGSWRGLHLARRWADLTLPMRRWLGPRFELSILLLTSLIDLSMARLMTVSPQEKSGTLDAGIQGVCAQSLRDRQSHAAFMAERLTQEFADFNFVRRNLRRWRLRGMFAMLLAWVVLTQARLIGERGLSQREFVIRSWNSFEGVLERMVPYRRDSLLATLGAQEDEPYEASRVSL